MRKKARRNRQLLNHPKRDGWNFSRDFGFTFIVSISELFLKAHVLEAQIVI